MRFLIEISLFLRSPRSIVDWENFKFGCLSGLHEFKFHAYRLVFLAIMVYWVLGEVSSLNHGFSCPGV